MAKPVTPRRGFGPLNFRLPLASSDREQPNTLTLLPSESRNGWPAESLLIELQLVAPKSVPAWRPIFPGQLKFVARTPTDIPDLDDIGTDAAGKVDANSLAKCTIVGDLVVVAQGAGSLDRLKKLGTLDALGEAPTWALYGSVKLTPAFFTEALFATEGLAEQCRSYGKNYKPSDKHWQKLALHGFLSGTHTPIIRCGDTIDKDDAERFAMPELELRPNGKYQLAVALGWPRDERKTATTPTDPNVEITPAIPFLRHIAAHLREKVTGQARQPVLDAIFENETTSKPWHDRLRAQLSGMGFGSLRTELPLRTIIREFQIAAAADIVATGADKILPARLALRDFRDIVATSNVAVYSGPISGRANMATRQTIVDWSDAGQRNPLIIAAFKIAKDSDLTVAPGQEPEFADIWSRQEVTKASLRMFAADFTRLPANSQLDEPSMEFIGNCAPYEQTSGPNTLIPTPARHLDFAEFRPGRVGLDEVALATATDQSTADFRLASTFRVIRAVSEIECYGNLDQINGSDDAGLSYGPCHWSLAFAKKGELFESNPVRYRNHVAALGEAASTNTELGGFAAYLSYLDELQQPAGVDVFKPQGLGPILGKISRATAGKSLSNAALKWRLGFVNDGGGTDHMTVADVLEAIPSWRNFYRWVAIGRRNELIGPATWGFAHRRLFHLMTATFPKEALTEYHQKKMPNPTLLTVFTSELNAALLLRWHVKRSGDLLKTAKIGEVPHASELLTMLYDDAVDNADQTKPDLWQEGLRTQIRAKAVEQDADLGTDFDKIVEQPWWANGSNERGHKIDRRLTTLAMKDGSFKLARYTGP